mgnify:CR=1 FL=1
MPVRPAPFVPRIPTETRSPACRVTFTVTAGQGQVVGTLAATGYERCGRSWGMDDRSHTWNKYSHRNSSWAERVTRQLQCGRAS